MCPESGLRTALNWPKIRKMTVTSQFSDMTSGQFFFDVILLLSSSLVTGPSLMSVSSLVLELWQYSFKRDWPEIRKSEIPPSDFCPISGDWSEIWIPNLARMFLIKCYWMLQMPPSPRLGLNISLKFNFSKKFSQTGSRDTGR